MNRSSEPERRRETRVCDLRGCRQSDSRQAMKRIACWVMVVACVSLGLRSSGAAQSAYPFETYEVPLYQGQVRYPDFRNRDRAFAMFRTRIREGLQHGVNFAGRFSLIQFGCGTGCSFVYVTDVSSGRVYSLPRGGEDNLYLRLHFTPKSSLIVTRWYGPDVDRPQGGEERCVEEMLVWRGGHFDRIDRTVVGDQDACLQAWPERTPGLPTTATAGEAAGRPPPSGTGAPHGQFTCALTILTTGKTNIYTFVPDGDGKVAETFFVTDGRPTTHKPAKRPQWSYRVEGELITIADLANPPYRIVVLNKTKFDNTGSAVAMFQRRNDSSSFFATGECKKH
jgi:hypothetical protein